MHDVLDPRDLVPDEAEQLAVSGYMVHEFRNAAAAAAAAGDLGALAEIEAALATVERDPSWRYDEPDDEQILRDDLEKLEPIDTDPNQLGARIRGAWLGRTIGNTLGKPLEGLTRGEVETYLRAAAQWPLTGYVRLLDPLPEGVSQLHPSATIATAGNFAEVPRDDDIDWTILALFVLEKHGRAATTEQIAAAWLDRLPFTQTYTAERAAYRNLALGLRPPQTATYRNPYREWIGALIRGDMFGLVNPGDIRSAASLALTDARLSHVGNGLYGEMWAAALVASALAAESAMEVYDAALGVVPPRSRLAEVLRGTRDQRAAGATWHQALDWVDTTLSQYSWVHTLNNAAIIAIALLWGEDFTHATAIAIAGGRDTDSTTATVGSVMGALHGDRSIPSALVGTTHGRVRSAVRDFDRVTVDELSARTMRLIP